jgi:hypothetical protein
MYNVPGKLASVGRFFLGQMLKMAQKMSNLIELPAYSIERSSVQQGELVQE